MAEFRIMKLDDIERAFEIVDIMNWGYFERDIRRLIEFDPQGNFVALDNGKIVGVGFTSLFDDFAFIGPVIVIREYRGQKIGEELMKMAIDHLVNMGAKTIELDAVFEAARLYRRLGFRDKYFSYRMWRVSDLDYRQPAITGKSQVDQIIAFDRKMTGIDREKHLRRFCDEFADELYVLSNNNAELTAYAIARERKADIVVIGPLVAADDQAASELFKQVYARYRGREVGLGLLEPNRFAIQMLRDTGFVHNQPALRMYYGERREYHEHIYSIMSAEKG